MGFFEKSFERRNCMEVILILAGIVIGIGIAMIIFRAYFIGTLRIDKSDPTEEPYMFLELDKGIGDISSKKHVVLRVSTKNYGTCK